MPMIRSLATAALFAAITTLNAQSRDIQVADTKAMTDNAAKHMALVDKAVDLDDDQKVRVQDVYMQLERQLNALDQRYTTAGLTPEQRKAEMDVMWQSLDRFVETNLTSILAPSQMEKWRAASR